MSAKSAQKIADKGELFPIRTIAALTGVHAVTLRAWERRYGLIKPIRTAKGHRLYTQDHIDLIHRVVGLLERGIPVGQARHLLETPSAGKPASSDPWLEACQRLVAAISRFDEDGLENIYSEALSLYPSDLVNRKLLVPVLAELGRRWETTEGSVAEEHFFGVYLRNKLGARFHHRRRGNRGPKLLAACLPGEQHEVGLLLFALAAHDRGFQLSLLGANMPLEDLPIAAKRAHAEAIVLSGSLEPAAEVLRDTLPRVCATVSLPVFVGGNTSIVHHDDIVRAGAQPLGSDIEQGVRRLAERLRKSI